MNCGDETSDVGPPIDEALCFSAALSIPDIDPYDGHVRFGRHFDYSLFRGQDDIIEDVVALKDFFNVIQGDINVGLLRQV